MVILKKPKPILIILLVFLGVFLGSCSVECKDHLVLESTNIQEIKSHEGCEATVQGTVLNTHVLNNHEIIFLNLGDSDYQKAFSVLIFKSNLERFVKVGIQAPEKYYNYKAIAVTGTITKHQGRPQIIVASPEQIKIDSQPPQ